MEDYLVSDKFRNETVARMSGAIQIPTQSYDDMGDVNEDERWNIFYDLAAYLEKTFPLVHNNLKLEHINEHGLLFTWEGDKTLKPTVLMAHQDVVPVAVPTWDQWTHPPFSGHYDGKYIWGRGASDCKNTLIGILEAVEMLIHAGFEPKRTLVLSFGFDEEISGRRGAGHLASVLIERYGKDGAAIIVDEGSGITSAWGSTFALPGVGEKGYLDVEIIVRMPGGHSSVPPAHNGIGVMSELITLIEADPYEPHFHSENPFLGLLQCGAAHSPEFPSKLKKLLPSHQERVCGKKDKLAQEASKLGDEIKYLFTTSAAPDIIEGGVKVNALPERTRLVVNHRVNVGDSSSVVKDKLTKLATIVAKKYNLTVNAFSDESETPRSITLSTGTILEPAPVTPTLVGKTPYSILSGTTRAMYGENLIMAPGIMTGNTDTRYYWDLTKHIFRFIPGWDPEQNFMDGIHTVDEKVGVIGHIRNVQWFSSFIRNMDEADLE
ncbi:putative carboxypeptidase s protein [Phaeoacremonium minimum UCRPA7]|uniref:Putative carboxypeptidase s protein n=1 Tax=Phaeoacremonium minimum (strain UCR-PA7) TaxID=1286976 RepID=R8BAS1_PHAM7|nr:putative carboxypeptidase s protein [Phaeoacremonium minimum UCRPA7]EON96418.1 putative carboxypeptidase s protein [Phaeoacremonium minimum UCRPA7]